MKDSTIKVTANVKEFKSLSVKLGRVIESKWFKYWESHEDETAHGWMFHRTYPYRKSAEKAKDRYEMLFDRMVELHEEASEFERPMMEAADEHFVVTC
jgi:hypothetical protein